MRVFAVSVDKAVLLLVGFVGWLDLWVVVGFVGWLVGWLDVETTHTRHMHMIFFFFFPLKERKVSCRRIHNNND